MKLAPETVKRLQQNTANVRNICILAHVDHGKTSLSDSLLATNGIISQRMAGKVRYLDSREDEQLRGITMESSAISLYFRIMRRKEGSEETETKEHLINLIDSPGHIDFSSEVSSASRLCDGAVVLVDVVEGVCSQTVNVLRQCWVDNLKPLLVVNKIDRLITEWKLLPLEAYQHISRVIEQVNSVIGSFFAGDRMEEDLKWREAGATGEFVEKSDVDLYFTPEKNNVIFASAIDGWAFSINTFARIYLAKLGFSHTALSKTLWGDFYLDMKNKKVIPGAKLKPSQSNLKPLFVSLILEQIWNIYDACVLERDDEKLLKIVAKLGAKISPRDLRSKDYKNLLNLIMSQWIPLSHALLGAVIEYLPNPLTAQRDRIDKILDECLYSAFDDSLIEKESLIDPDFKNAITNCESSLPEEHTLAYVSKMLSIPDSELPKEVIVAPTQEELEERHTKAREQAKRVSEAAAVMADLKVSQEEDEIYLETKPDQFQWEFEEDEEEENEKPLENETLIAFTRVYSGELSRGQRVCVVGPKYDPSLPKDHPNNIEQLTEDIEIEDLLLIMGREFVRVDSVPGGNIVGVVGLGDIILKNATIMSEVPDEKPYLNLASTSTLIHNKPIMKVAIEPNNPLKLYKLEKGLDLLSKADPVLEWYVDDDSGELIVCVAGELHLERCLQDLEKRFAPGCEVVVKEPVIPFREGLAFGGQPSPDLKEVLENEDDEAEVEQDEVELNIDVFPLKPEVTKFLIDNEKEISSFVALRLKYSAEEATRLVQDFRHKLSEVIEENSLDSKVLAIFGSIDVFIDNIISFGPKRIGPNVFVEDPLNKQQFRRVFTFEKEEKFVFESNVLNGFQLAMNEGPLASEPIQGTITVLRKSFKPETEELLLNLPGRLLKRTQQLIHAGFLRNAPRLFLAMYTCEIQTYPEVLGKVYAVIQKRGGTIISEEMNEGTPFFIINARIPVVEAFGFSEEIRKRTSGAASPQLLFDGFDMLDIDPFWVPHTVEELEDLGTFAERENTARKYMNAIRRRKGLFVDEKVVKNAEKQRTLKKD